MITQKQPYCVTPPVHLFYYHIPINSQEREEEQAVNRLSALLIDRKFPKINRLKSYMSEDRHFVFTKGLLASATPNTQQFA